MKKRRRKLLAYILVTILVCQLAGDDVLKLMAAEHTLYASYMVEEDSEQDFIFASGGITLTVEEGVTVSGVVDFSSASTGANNTLKNSGTIKGNIMTGSATGEIYNYGTILSPSFNLSSGSVLYNTGSVSNVTVEGGDLEVTGGSIDTITDTTGSYILLSGCSVGTVTSHGGITVEGTVSATSITAKGINSDSGGATVNITDYVKIPEGINNAKLSVQKTTVIDVSEGSGYYVYYNNKQYPFAAGDKGSILDYYGKTVSVFSPEDSHIIVSGVSEGTAYLPGETADTITLRAEEGYYFPDNYCDSIVGDGAGTLTAKKVNDGEITISYVLSDKESKDVIISVEAANKKPKENGKGTIQISDIYYGGEFEVTLTSDTNDVDSAKIEYKKKSASDSSYSTEKPTKVGTYIAKATFKENDTYTMCEATTQFKIKYLPIPESAYVIKGDRGENGFYTSAVEIVPLHGYSVAGRLDGSYKKKLEFTSSKKNPKAYFKKNETGEKTKGTNLPELKIDFTLPYMSATHGTTYYGKSVTLDVSDANLCTVTCNNVEMTLTDGKVQLILDSNHGSSNYRIYAKDLAGNSRQIDITIAEEWLKTGIIPTNQLVRLIPNTSYKLAEGTWRVAGDTTQYSGGREVYVRSEGEYTFGNE